MTKEGEHVERGVIPEHGQVSLRLHKRKRERERLDHVTTEAIKLSFSANGRQFSSAPEAQKLAEHLKEIN